MFSQPNTELVQKLSIQGGFRQFGKFLQKKRGCRKSKDFAAAYGHECIIEY
jgi:hypothetical protein